MNKKSKEREPAFPGKVNAMGYRDGLTKLEFISALIMSNMYSTMDQTEVKAAAWLSVNAAKALLTELEENKES